MGYENTTFWECDLCREVKFKTGIPRDWVKYRYAYQNLNLQNYGEWMEKDLVVCARCHNKPKKVNGFLYKIFNKL